MKIFYGVQGTGNGHITRARIMAKELYAAGIDVTFQFSGRPYDQFFDMQVFNGFQHRDGLTFNTDNGQVNYIKTAIQTKPLRFIQDVKALDLSAYDLVISDFEPVTAWAAKTQKKKVVGLGHQYAFNHDIPRKGSDPIANQIMKYFAPSDIGIGLHWHHFGQPILPPIIETPKISNNSLRNKIVVYLPFENQHEIIKHLCVFENFHFHIYSPTPVDCPYAHITCNPLSREGFKKDLYDCAGIISNAGFELASEALYLGKKILVKPLHSQMEQISNAAALEQLGYGCKMEEIDSEVIEQWLHQNHAVRITYPNTAKFIVDWIKGGLPKIHDNYIRQAWKRVDVLQINI